VLASSAAVSWELGLPIHQAAEGGRLKESHESLFHWLALPKQHGIDRLHALIRGNNNLARGGVLPSLAG
jgi:hypothetical protein